jgi:3-deoxy-D-manno-octulosonic-acid transferase
MRDYLSEHRMRLSLRLYSLLWWCLLPLVLLRLVWLGRREPGYRAHIAERLGRYKTKPAAPLIWLHAVSVGETRAAEPLVGALLAEYPGCHLLMTHMTPTGRATGKALFGDEPRVVQAYLPYDNLSMTANFIRHYRPRIGLLMETEVWPSLLASCELEGVPVALINARLSERSLRRGQRFASLLGDAAKRFALVAAQTQEDATRLAAMGARHVQVTGNLKFDVDIPEAMRAAGISLRRQIGIRPVLLCASTREGEEALLLAGYMKATLPPDFLLMIVPRHPQRFAEVAKLFEDQGLRVVCKSQLKGEAMPADAQVLVGDTMGEMVAYYSACDFAFIGGSLLPLGGQNLIEACACGKPVLLGPHTFNFAQASEEAIAQGAALRVYDAAQVFRIAFDLLMERERLEQMSQAAMYFAGSSVGATARTLALICALTSAR